MQQEGIQRGRDAAAAIDDRAFRRIGADLLERRYADLDVVIIESGGDNLASTFSLDLVDFWMFVIDVAGGDDIPRKRGPGVVQCDLLIINKLDLAPYVGVDLERMVSEAESVRHGKPVLCTNCAKGEGLDAVVDRLQHEVLFQDAAA